jgi:alpha-mannosidase
MKNCSRILLVLLALAVTTAAQERRIWQIGDFNDSSSEFSDATSQGTTFQIGSNGVKDWPSTLSAISPEQAATAKPLRIAFSLVDVPDSAFELQIAELVLTPRLPVILVEVNGHRGWFYRRPEIDYHEGNIEGSIFPQYSIGTRRIQIPNQFLKRGENEISLLAVTDPISSALPGGKDLSDASITFDAIAFVNIQSDTRREVLTAEAWPTVFFRRNNGALSEVVSVLIRWQGFVPRGSVTLSQPGWSRTDQPETTNDFGEQKVEFLTPEFKPNTRFQIKINTNGRDATFEKTLNPAKKWTIYLVPHEHLDIGYSDFQTKLAELHSQVIDEALELCREHPDFRFSLDGYWQAQQFLEGRSEQEKQKLYTAIREKKIFVPAQHSVMLTGFPTAETLLRSFYGSHKLNQAAGGDWNYANSTDVPSYSWSYASLMASSGIKYFSAAANADRGPSLMLGDLHRHSPFWWEGPDGSRILMWYARHYHQIRSEFGLPPVIATGYEALPSFLHVYDRPDYTSNAVMLHGSQWENTSLYHQQASLAQNWNKTFAYPELRFSGFAEALEAIKNTSKQIPVVRGDGGPFWEDGIASDASVAALERENERRAVSAEKLSTIASLVDPDSKPSRTALDTMWENILLMNEHTWGWGRSVTEPNSEDSTKELSFKRLRATVAKDSIDYVLDRAMTAVAREIQTPSRALVVFNTLNWQRNGWVEFDLQKTRQLIDLQSQEPVSFEVLRDEAAYQRIRFLARNVPAMGYKTYAVVDKTDTVANASSTASNDTDAATMENTYYRIVFDPNTASVRSIYDKQLRRELVDQNSRYRFNEYLYVTGGDNFPNQLLTYRKWSPVAQLDIHPATNGRIVSIKKSPAGMVAELESSGVNTPHIRTEIILFDGEKKIEINNYVKKELVYKKEAVYFAFPVAIRAPQFNYEIQTTSVDPEKQMISGAGREWFSAQNWISMSEPGVAISIINRDSFLWSFGDIVRGTWPTEFGKRSAVAFSYVMNNYWNTNYVAAQGGEFAFRYVVTSASVLDRPTISRMGWSETTPFERVLMKSQDQTFPAKRTLPAAGNSFLGIDSPSVLLTTWKQAEDGTGTILRFLNLDRTATKFTVDSAFVDGKPAQLCTAMEDCSGSIPSSAKRLSLPLSPSKMATVKIKN